MHLILTPAHAEELACKATVRGLQQHLRVSVKLGEIVEFNYTGLTPAPNGKSSYSCSVSASRSDNKSEWIVERNTTTIRLRDSAAETDEVLVVRKQNAFLFDLSNVSPLNCGQSSVIVAKIKITRGRTRCHGMAIQN